MHLESAFITYNIRFEYDALKVANKIIHIEFLVDGISLKGYLHPK